MRRKPIKWLTQAQIKAAAAESPKAAAECSSLHWLQIKKSGPRRFWAAVAAGEVLLDADYCALCRRYSICYGGKSAACLLRQNCGIGKEQDACCKEYYPADATVRAHKTGLHWPPAVAKAIQALIDKIDSKIGE